MKDVSFGIVHFFIRVVEGTLLITPHNVLVHPYTICTSRPVPLFWRPDLIWRHSMSSSNHNLSLQIIRTLWSHTIPLVNLWRSSSTLQICLFELGYLFSNMTLQIIRTLLSHAIPLVNLWKFKFTLQICLFKPGYLFSTMTETTQPILQCLPRFSVSFVPLVKD